MASSKYLVTYKKSVDKDLRKLDIITRQKIVSKIQSLANNPHPVGSSKLHGANDLYRLRHTDYRVIYQIKDKKLIVLVIKVGHRREIYRSLS